MGDPTNSAKTIAHKLRSKLGALRRKFLNALPATHASIPGGETPPGSRPATFVERSSSPYVDEANPVGLYAFYCPSNSEIAQPSGGSSYGQEIEPLLEGWREDSSRIKQEIELARHYGIQGFVVECDADNQDLAIQLAHDLSRANDSGFSFCVSIQAQEPAVIERIEALFALPGYKCFSGRPLLVVESPHAEDLSDLLPQLGGDSSPLKRPFLVFAATREFAGDPKAFGVDAILQLAPNTVRSSRFRPRKVFGETQAPVYSDYRLMQVMVERPVKDYADFEAVYSGWRSQDATYAYSDPIYYERWLTGASTRTAKNKNLPEAVVFIKSWNDLRHDATLIPDRRFGYKLLESTFSALRATEPIIYKGTRNFDLEEFVARRPELSYKPRPTSP